MGCAAGRGRSRSTRLASSCGMTHPVFPQLGKLTAERVLPFKKDMRQRGSRSCRWPTAMGTQSVSRGNPRRPLSTSRPVITICKSASGKYRLQSIEINRTPFERIPAGGDRRLFVHGALCMCVSGQCYLSSVLGQRSGNRGLCAQPCRLGFETRASSHADSSAAAERQRPGPARSPHPRPPRR